MTDADDDKTVLVKRARQTSPGAGGRASDNALPPGTQLAEFRILGLIGEGGFGIVYLAYDTQLGRNVALKEYFPGSLATRVGDTQVTVRSTRHEETLAAGLKSFINEARLLAQFDHRSLVNVYRFWEANGTAYMVMPYYDGVTLKDTLHEMDAPPSEAWLRSLLAPVIEALGVLHGVQCYHRDIAPDNIMLLKSSGRPVLLDFGAARRVISDMSQALTVILKPGFAPVEQYAAVASMKQGPWTDIYALAAVVHCAIQGTTPPASVGRLMSDSYVPLAEAAAGRYSDAFLRAIDHALAVRPEDRPQSVEAFAHELGLDVADEPPRGTSFGTSAGTSFGTSAGTSAVSPGVANATGQRPPASVMPDGPGARGTGMPAASTPARAAATPPRAARVPRAAMYAAAAVVVAVLAGAFGWRAMQPSAPSVSTAQSSPDPVAPPDAGTTAAVTERAPQTSGSAPADANALRPDAATAAASAPSTTDTAPATLGAPLSGAFNAAEEFGRIVALSDPAIRVTATLRKSTARLGKDPLQFKITSSQGGYLYIFIVDPEGQYLMLFPNKIDGDNAIRAGRPLSLPRSSWTMLAAKPPGPNRFLALVSPMPRDFSASGLRQDDVFAGFSADAQRDGALRRTTTYSPFAGEPRCPAGNSDCARNFGATTFEIEVVSGAPVPSGQVARESAVARAAKRG